MKLRKELLARLAHQRRLAEEELATAKVELAQAETKLAAVNNVETEFVRQVWKERCEYWRGQINAFKGAAFVIENALDTYEECDE